MNPNDCNDAVLTAQDAEPIALRWLDAWQAACAREDAQSLGDALCSDCHWRDLVAFCGTVRTWSGRGQVIASLLEHLPRTKPVHWRLHQARPLLRQVQREGSDWLELSVEFDTVLARGEGLVRLRIEDDGRWRAWTVMTSVQWWRGHEPLSMRRHDQAQHARRFAGPNWADQRAAAQAYQDHDPDVLVVGAGQAGLSIAARLTQLGIDTLVIDKHQHPGDNWRTRYHALVLHNQTKINHLPYMPFPDVWPTYIPKDKLADWMAYYAQAMEINQWTDTEFLGADWDASAQRWRVRLHHRGAARSMSPRHLVMAIGVSAMPRRGLMPGMENYQGRVIHSHDYRGAQGLAGQRVLVIGSGTSGHDVAQDLHSHGVQVSLVQRGATMVQNIEPTAQQPYELYESGLGVDVCDLITTGTPMVMIKAANRRYLRMAQESDRALHDGLRRAGFKLDDGSAHGMNWQMLYLTRGGGYYFNVGCSDLIAQGKLPLLAAADIAGFEPRGLRLHDGRHMEVDLIVMATGYLGLSDMVEKWLGPDLARRIGQVWGIDEQTQELANMWHPTPQSGLWFIGGSFAQCRIYSHHLALQIQARLLGLLPT